MSGARWERRFLEVFAATGVVRLAASAAGVSRDAPYKRARRSPAFSAAWQRAREESVDTLEAEARRRAMSGSDALLMFLLRGQRPGLYRERLQIDFVAEATRIAELLGVDPKVALDEVEAVFKELR